MKKGLCLLLSATMIVGLLAGCGQKPEPVTPKPPVIVDDNPVVLTNEKVEVPRDIIKYSEKDEVIKVLSDKGYNMKKGYAVYPNEDYFYPEYVQTEEGLKVVFLSQKTLFDTNGKQEDRNYYSDMDLMMNFSSVKGDMYKAYSPTNSIFGAISGAVGAITGGSSGIIPSWNADGNASLGEAQGNISSAPSEMVMPGGEYFYYEPEDFNTSEFKEVEESNYLNVLTSPLSTFAADVDTASYTNYRNILRNKLWYTNLHINEDLHDIRVEEIMNYFNYDFAEGKNYINDKFAISAEIGDTPWNVDSKLLVVNVKAKELSEEEKQGSNLVFLIDTSGSMNRENKIGLLVASMKLLVEQLTEEDTVSIVTYASDDRVVLDGVKGSEKEKIIDALDELIAGGSTNGEGGIKKAYKIAQKYMDGHSNSRIIMCSDGDLNVGISSEDALIDLIEEKRETGVYLSVLGFGEGNYKDNKMEALANHGNGNYYYIDTLKEGYKVLVEDLTSTLVTIADDVKFQLEFNPEYIKGYRKIGYENRDMANEDFHDDTKDGGEVGYGHEVTVVYELIMNDSNMELSNTDLKYQQSTTTGSSDWLTVSIRYKDHGEAVSNLIEYVVDEGNYLEENTDDWRFVSDVIGFALIANNSEYANGLKIDTVIADLDSLNLVDINKQEFYGLTIGYGLYLEETEKEVEEYFEEEETEIEIPESNEFVDLANDAGN